MKKIFVLLLLAIVAHAKNVTATFTYTMGDRDTKIEAKKIAFAEAKRMAIEKIGVWLESETNIVNGQMERDKIRSFVLGYARTKIVSENFAYPSYTVTVELEIDDEQLKNMRTEETLTPAVDTTPVQPAPEVVPEPVPSKEHIMGTEKKSEWYDNFEIGMLFGSGSLNITQTDVTTQTETKKSYGIGFGGAKIAYLFTKHHAVEFIGGGGSTETDSGDTLQVDTSAVAYLYHFSQVTDEPIFPYLAFGFTSGKATLTNSSGTTETIYEGSGATLHGGAKWFFLGDRHHLFEAGLLVQSFTDNQHEPGSPLESIQFERAILALGYSYRF